MIRKDFEKSEKFKIMQTIGASYNAMEFHFVNNGEDLVCRQNGVDYHPHEWFQYVIMYCAFKTESIKGDENKVSFLGEVRCNIIQLNEVVKRMLLEAGVVWSKRYDFSGFVNQIDGLVQTGKLELEAKLLISQLGTNENVKTTNRRMQIILIVTVFVAAVNIIPPAMEAYHDFKKDTLEDTIKTRDNTIKSLELKLSAKDLKIDSLMAQLKHPADTTRK